jgi:hypothetical protein
LLRIESTILFRRSAKDPTMARSSKPGRRPNAPGDAANSRAAEAAGREPRRRSVESPHGKARERDSSVNQPMPRDSRTADDADQADQAQSRRPGGSGDVSP